VTAKIERPRGEKEDVHLIEIPGADHYDLIDPASRAWKKVEDTVIELSA
jgi:hypothetical protein